MQEDGARIAVKVGVRVAELLGNPKKFDALVHSAHQKTFY